jgi:hypothetical protein
LEDLVLVITFPTLPRVWNVSWNGALGNPVQRVLSVR